jgi:hypothetical protein
MIILFILLIIMVILCFQSKNTINNKDTDNIKILFRQANRWSNASQQDKNPLIATLHANYGVGYLLALRDLYNDDEISKITGVDSRTFSNKIVSIQDKATKNMVKLCPEHLKHLDKELTLWSILK